MATAKSAVLFLHVGIYAHVGQLGSQGFGFASRNRREDSGFPGPGCGLWTRAGCCDPNRRYQWPLGSDAAWQTAVPLARGNSMVCSCPVSADGPGVDGVGTLSAAGW